MITIAAPPSRSRNALLDAARGCAIVAMVVYHFSWDLAHVGLLDVDVAQSLAWRWFARTIAASFLTITGISLTLASHPQLDSARFMQRLMRVAGAAGAVTVATYIAFPDAYIFFGILHCIAVSSLLGILFLRVRAPLLLLTATVVIALPHFWTSATLNHPGLAWLGLGTLMPRSNDFEPIFPWFGFVLIGMALGRLSLFRSDVDTSTAMPVMQTAGRHSLAIYLIHQPLLLTFAVGLTTLPPLHSHIEKTGFSKACSNDCAQGGQPLDVCTAACTCITVRFNNDPLWQKIIKNTLTPDENEYVIQTGRRCFDDARHSKP